MLAEEDFKMRGAGDFLGYSQHGSGQFPTDTDMINLAKNVKESILLDKNAVARIEKSITTSKYEFFNGITLN
jgi:RecG-like helicase